MPWNALRMKAILILKMLLDHRADVTITDKKGKTALDHAKALRPSYIEESEKGQWEENRIKETILILEQALAKQQRSTSTCSQM